MVMVFDCETIPDVELIKQGFRAEFEKCDFVSSDDLEISKKAMEIQKENSGSGNQSHIYIDINARRYAYAVQRDLRASLVDIANG